MKTIKIYDGITIDMSTSEVIEHGKVTYVPAVDVAQLGGGGGGGGTQTTVQGFADEFRPQIKKLFDSGIGLYEGGELGRVAGFNATQEASQQAGAAAAGRQVNLEGQLFGGTNTYNQGLETRSVLDAQRALGGLNAGAGATGNLGGSRQALSQSGLQNNLAADLAGIRAQGAQQNFQNKGTALAAQGTGAGTLGRVGGARQDLSQQQLDAPYQGWAQLLGPITGVAGKSSTTTTTGGGK